MKITLIALFCGISIMLAGCGSDDAPTPTSIVGPNNEDALWSLTVKSGDGLIEFNDSLLRIATNSGGYKVAWMSDTFNGTAGFNTNTFTVTMKIDHSTANLDLFGTLHDNNFMSGAGTISGYPGPRVVNWRATRD